MRKKLLLIEDDSFMRDMITLVLESADYEVSGAENGAIALKLLREHGGYDAVISDMYLPDMDGVMLFAQCNAGCPGLPFFILSGETDEAVIRKTSSLGIPYIVKDENFAAELLAALKKIRPASQALP